MIELLVVAPTEQFRDQVPRGISYTDEVFGEAKLEDPISKSQYLTSEIRRALVYLSSRYPGRIRAQWVELWSIGGLWCAFRYRLRSFPSIILGHHQILTGDDLEFKTLIENITTLLEKPSA